MSNLFLFVVIIAMGVYLYRIYQRDAAGIRNDRGGLLDSCINLLENPIIQQVGAGFPKLSGLYKGHEITLELMADTLAVRKVPPLWLLVTVKGRQAISGTLDMIVRPQNNEFYSPAWQWEGQLAIPASWPQHAIIKYQSAPVPLGALIPLVPPLFADEHMKELLILPNSLRLTYLAKQAQRGEYMVMRNSVFDATPLEPQAVACLIEQAINLRTTMELSHESNL